MKLNKSLLLADDVATADDDRTTRQMALEYVAHAWNEAEDDGIDSNALAHASLFAALTAFVEQHGEDATAALIETLPERIRQGDYNLYRSLQ